MNKYESVIIINPSIKEQAIKDIVTKEQFESMKYEVK